MGNFVGIDLGTTFSVLSIFNEDGQHEIVYDSERFLPSVVYFGDEIIVGSPALQALEIDSKNVVVQIKKKMPINHEFSQNFNGIDYSPQQISSFILKKLITDAKSKIGEVTDATITIPAFFNDIAREATINAAKDAGITNPSIISEPVAAGIFYSRTKNINGNILVYDLGGGTLDCSIIKIDKDDVEVLGSKGESFGGTDFDSKLFEIINDEYKIQKGENISDNLEEYRKMRQSRWEGYKKTLDFVSELKAVIDSDKGPFPFKIPAEIFNKSLEEYIIKSEMILTLLMEELNMTPKDIDEVVLVGGSTRSPLFQNHLKSFFNKKNLISTVNVDEVVSLGASLHCSIVNSEKQSIQQKDKVGNIELTNVVNHYYGVLVTEIDKTIVNEVIIKKNEKFPIELVKQFATSTNMDYQGFTVTQSEIDTDDTKFVEVIAKGRVTNLGEFREAGMPLEVTFSIDENQILRCKCKDITSGKEEIIEKNLNF